jgi:uncharacterized protein YcnI
MKCSGWSSRAISACIGLVSGLVLAAPAAAHVIASPTYVPGGDTSTIMLSVPNERGEPMTGVIITVPQGFRIVSADPVGEWNPTVQGMTATWAGGGLPGNATANVTLALQAPKEPGAVTLLAEETYGDGGIVRRPVALTVVPGAKPSQNLGTALVVGILGLLVVTTLVVLRRQRRARSLQEK